MSTRDLIDAIQAGDSTKVDDTFNSVMVQKVSERLDAMRDDLSQNMFRAVDSSAAPAEAVEGNE
jgi:hypothetical protein